MPIESNNTSDALLSKNLDNAESQSAYTISCPCIIGLAFSIVICIVMVMLIIRYTPA